MKYHLIEPKDKIVLGVSGGPDSIAMLVCLNELSKEMDFNILVCHINHGIRENAKLDEKYVKDFCDKLNVPCFAAGCAVVVTGSGVLAALDALYSSVLFLTSAK